MTTVDEYLQGAPSPQKEALEHVRATVRQAIPDITLAEELITYGMPGFKYKGKYLFGYASFKDHMSVFPASEPIEIMRDRLQGYTLSKGTIQFSIDNPIADGIIKELVDIRIRSINEGEKAL